MQLHWMMMKILLHIAYTVAIVYVLCVLLSLCFHFHSTAEQVMIILIVNNFICISNSFQQIPKKDEWWCLFCLCVGLFVRMFALCGVWVYLLYFGSRVHDSHELHCTLMSWYISYLHIYLYTYYGGGVQWKVSNGFGFLKISFVCFSHLEEQKKKRIRRNDDRQLNCVHSGNVWAMSNNKRFCSCSIKLEFSLYWYPHLTRDPLDRRHAHIKTLSSFFHSILPAHLISNFEMKTQFIFTT